MAQKAIIAGGSGLLGRALARLLAGEGWEVVILTRDPDKTPFGTDPAAGLIRAVFWEGKRGGAWTAELEGADALVNLAGRSINCVFTLENSREILESRLDAVTALGKALNKCKRPPPVWVQAGAVGCYGTAGEELCGEDSPMAHDFLAVVCRQWEAAFQQACPPEIRPVVLRLGIVLDRAGGAYPPLAQLTRRFLGGAAGSGRQGFSWVHGHDVRRAFRYAITGPEIKGAYNVCAPHPATNAEFMAALRRSLHRPWLPPAPAFLVKLAATHLMQTDPTLVLGGRMCTPARLLAQGFRFEYPDLASTLRDLG